MPNPEPTLAEICRQTREKLEKVNAGLSPSQLVRPWEPFDISGGMDEDTNLESLTLWLLNHALALVQAAEDGVTAKSLLASAIESENAAWDNSDQMLECFLKHAPPAAVTECLRRNGISQAAIDTAMVRVHAAIDKHRASQALSSGAPT